MKSPACRDEGATGQSVDTPDGRRDALARFHAARTELQDSALAGLAARYVESLLRGDRKGACSRILEAVRQGVPVREAYLNVLQPAQWEVGRLWQTGVVSVAVEHFCTAATQLVMSELFPLVITTDKNGLSMAGCCVGDELHEVGLRMVCDFFEMASWETCCLGAVSQTDAVLDVLERKQPDVLCVSVTMHHNLPLARTLVQEASRRFPRLKILVGGFPFLLNPDLATDFGAHGWAPDAQEAVNAALSLCRESRRG